MKNILCLFVITTFASCASTNNISEKRCETILKNDYKNILVEKFESNVDNETLFFNEVKYECVHSAMYTAKVMYDKFGKWNNAIFPKGERHPLLVWKNVKLFPNDSTEFIVATNGLESIETIYASVLVFDKQNNDLLTENSVYKAKLIEYFSGMIRANNSKKEEFYEIYWKTVDPKAWKRINSKKNN